MATETRCLQAKIVYCVHDGVSESYIVVDTSCVVQSFYSVYRPFAMGVAYARMIM